MIDETKDSTLRPYQESRDTTINKKLLQNIVELQCGHYNSVGLHFNQHLCGISPAWVGTYLSCVHIRLILKFVYLKGCSRVCWLHAEFILQQKLLFQPVVVCPELCNCMPVIIQSSDANPTCKPCQVRCIHVASSYRCASDLCLDATDACTMDSLSLAEFLEAIPISIAPFQNSKASWKNAPGSLAWLAIPSVKLEKSCLVGFQLLSNERYQPNSRAIWFALWTSQQNIDTVIIAFHAHNILAYEPTQGCWLDADGWRAPKLSENFAKIT